MTNKPIALVTGASSGIGAVYADRFAARGHDLILVARRAERLEALAGRLSAAHGVAVDWIAADLTKDAELARVERVLATNPRVAVLVNNAGDGKLGVTLEARIDEMLATLALNVTALTRLTKAVLPAFVARDAGAIINVASVLSLHALPISALYSGTKAYVLTFSRGLQAELAGTGVRVQAVLPATTETEFFEQSGLPRAAFDPAVTMGVEDLVDAALVGFDRGESVTLPSLHDPSLWDAYDAARETLFAATQTNTPAPRYEPR